MRSNRVRAALFAVLLFGLGIAVGVLGQRSWVTTGVSAKTAEDVRLKYVTEMRTKLKLSQSQVDRLQVILDETKAKVKKVRDSYHPEIVKIKDAQITRVKAILSPEQSKQYDAMVAEREQHSKQQDEHDRMEDERQHQAHLKALEK